MFRYSRRRRSSTARKFIITLVVGVVAVWGIRNAIVLNRQLGASHGAQGGETDEPLMRWVETTTPQPASEPSIAVPALTNAVVETRHIAQPLLTPEQAASLRASGEQALSGGHMVQGRGLLNQALAGFPDEATQQEIRSRLATLNASVFLGPDVLDGDPYAHLVQIALGDSFVHLGHVYHVPAELIARINPQLSSRNLQVGTGIKVIYGPFHARVVKHAQRLDLYARDMYVQSFPISFDQDNYLPSGLYRVMRGGKISLNAGGPDAASRRWVLCEGTDPDDGQTITACIYGPAGPRTTTRTGLSGVKCGDDVLGKLYNTLIEQESFLCVDP